jgi:hypothetical protein
LITKRDYYVMDYLEKFKVMKTSQIHRAFFMRPVDIKYKPNVSKTFTRNRLNALTNMGQIKKIKGKHIDMDCLWYIKNKPKQIEHKLLVVEAWINLGMPEFFQLEYMVGKVGGDVVRADAYTEVKGPKGLYPVMIEIHRRTEFDFKKYERLYASGEWRRVFSERPWWKQKETFPRVLIVSDMTLRPPERSEINYRMVKHDFTNMGDLFK